MKKRIAILTMFIVVSPILSACASSVPNTSSSGEDTGTENGSLPTENSSKPSDTDETVNQFPDKLVPIPDSYLREAEQQGTLQDLYYDTYESFSYDENSQKLRKHAVVYLPYGYDESKQYPVFYLMHGGWSNEYVCSTYNNTSPEDSGDYSLALLLTVNYHNELINDLIPAVESKYSTYAEDTTPEVIAASRDYRTFCGFSMGSMVT